MEYVSLDALMGMCDNSFTYVFVWIAVDTCLFKIFKCNTCSFARFWLFDEKFGCTVIQLVVLSLMNNGKCTKIAEKY